MAKAKSAADCRTTITFKNEEQHRQAKAIASLKGMTLNAFVIDELEKALAREWKARTPQGYVPLEFLEHEEAKNKKKGPKK